MTLYFVNYLTSYETLLSYLQMDRPGTNLTMWKMQISGYTKYTGSFFEWKVFKNIALMDAWCIRWQLFLRKWPFFSGETTGQWRWAFMFSLICTWTNGCVHNRYADDFRRHRAHYGVIVMAPVVLKVLSRQQPCDRNLRIRGGAKNPSTFGLGIFAPTLNPVVSYLRNTDRPCRFAI